MADKKYTLKQVVVLSGMSTESFAKMIDVSYASLISWQNDSEKFRSTSIETLLKIQDASGVSIDQIDYWY